VRSFFPADSDQWTKVALDPGGIVPVGDRFREGMPQLRLRPICTVALEDLGVRLDDLADRPERDALPVGQTSPLPPAERLVARQRPKELERQPALPDARDTDERDELRLAIEANAFGGVEQQRELLVAADQRRSPRLLHVDAGLRARRNGSPHPNRLGPSLPPVPPPAR